MKVHILNEKVQLVRYKRVWYQVTRNGTSWQKLDPITQIGKPLPKDPVSAALDSIRKAHPIIDK